MIEQNENRIVLKSGTIIDKSTKSIITGTKYLFWGRRTIPFSDVVGVVVYSQANLEAWWGMLLVWLWMLSMALRRWAVGQLHVDSSNYKWLACIHYRGEKQTETEVVAWNDEGDEEHMIHLKEIISSAIGK